MRKSICVALLAATACGLPACKPDTAKTATGAAANNPASPAEVRAQFDILRDSADVSWQRMMASDDKKLADMRTLLADLGKQPSVNVAALDPLRQATLRLRPQRYDRQSMASSPRIDRYDTVQDSVLKVLYPLAAPEGNAPTAQIRDNVEAIQQADARVVRFRGHYDRAAKAYNAYLQVHGDELSKVGGAYAGLQPLPLFEVK